MNLFWLALSFLTTIPAKQIPYIPGGLGKSSTLFPLIGLMIGTLVLGSMWLTELVLADPIVAIIGLLVWVLLTGGLHLDGLADCCDGLLGAAPADKRLDILKDPRTGSFAVIGLILALGLKGTAIYVILDTGSSSWGWLPFLLAPVLARFLILPTAIQPQARPGGMGSDFATSITNNIIGLAAILPLLLIATGFMIGEPAKTIAACIFAGLGTAWWIYLARTRIGGVTGDVYGAVVETSEILILLGFCITIY